MTSLKKRLLPALILSLLAAVLCGCTGPAQTLKKMTPEESMQGKTTPGETTPGGTAPGETTLGEMTPGGTTPEETMPEIAAKPVEKEVLREGNLRDNMSLYEAQDEESVITMYLTVNSGNKADGTNHTWTEVNTYSSEYYADLGIDRYKVEGILQIDEGDGITMDSFGYKETVPNVSVQVRGQTSSRSKVKNYKVRIKEGKGKFRGQRTLNLNKHVSDPYRFTNKLCYDMLDDIPQLIGGRTGFVHLYVCDNTEGGNARYQDYGLYTMVEQVNKTFLRNRGLDENGQLYKVTFFEWNEYEAVSTPIGSADFDEAAFEEYMEIKGYRDNSKLNHVVSEVLNYMKPIDEIVEQYFDAENICYWMAFNILIGNHDSGARNLFLYSPLNSDKFYMICWDLDASLQKSYMAGHGYTEGLSWERGMSQYLGLTLTNRMLKEEKYRDMLDAAVDDLYQNYVNPSIVNDKKDRYQKIVMPFLYGGADTDNAKVDKRHFLALSEKLGQEVEENYQYYKETVDYPWPFYVAQPEVADDKIILSWQAAYDVNGKSVTYCYELARDYNFTDIVNRQSDLAVPSVSIERLEPGVYFLRVRATNESGYTQDCFDYISVRRQGKVYACLPFEVKEDGTIGEYTAQ